MSKKVILLTQDQFSYLIENVSNIYKNKNLNEGLKISIKKGRRLKLFGGKKSKTDYVDFENYTVNTPQENWDSFLSKDQKMVSLMNGPSKTNWSKLKNDPKNKGYAVASLERFNDTYGQNKWEKIIVGDEKMIENIPSNDPEKLYETKPMKFPSNLNPNLNFFVNNHYEVTPLFKETVKIDLIDPISKQMAQIENVPDDKPKAVLNSMDVLTSCSTIPNTKSPDGNTYSFDELSELRNKKATEYVLDELRKIGVVIPQNFVPHQDHKGKNGKGTSGPKWDPKKDNSPERRKLFEQYKYVDIDLEIIYNSAVKSEISQETDKIETIETNLYKVTFFAPSKGIYFRIPKLVIKSGRRKSRKKGRFLKCPFF